MILADIAHGEVGWADALFLIAAVVFFIAALVAYPTPQVSKASAFHGFLIGLGLTLVAIAFLLL